jgi:hypothetical protein
MLSRIGLLLISCLLFELVACSDQAKQPENSMESGGTGTTQGDSGNSKPGAPSSRDNLITMSFTKWGDVISVDAGLVYSEVKGGKCKFSKPVTTDESTRWSPFQIYWVIFDRQDEVRNGKEFIGIFYENESHKSDSLVRRDGARPHGFSYLTDQAAGYVNLSPVTMYDDDSRLHTVMNVAGHKAAIRSYAELIDGSCGTRTEACRGGEECYQSGNFAPLGNIHVVQNIVGLPREVHQEPTHRVAKSR